jgi:hypothetical protein
MLKELTKKILKTGTPSDLPAEHIKLFKDIEAFVLNSKQYVCQYSRIELKDCETYQTLKGMKPSEKVQVLESLIVYTNSLDKPDKRNKNSQHYKHLRGDDYKVASNLLDAFMRTRFDFVDDYSFVSLFNSLYASSKVEDQYSLGRRSVGAFVTMVEKHVKRIGLTNFIEDEINALLSIPVIKRINESTNTQSSYYGPDLKKAVNKLSMIVAANSDDIAIAPYQYGDGPMGAAFTEILTPDTNPDIDKWHTIFHHLATASGGKPSKKFLTQVNVLIDDIGVEKFKKNANIWFDVAANLTVVTKTRTNTYNGREYNYETYEYIENHSHNPLKGLLWSMSRFHDQESLKNIAQMSEKCFQKIPGVGPAAAGVGNSAIYALAQSKGLMGISHLSRLKLRIRQNNTQKLIQKYIDEQAAKQGIKSSQVEEIAASDYGLIDGERIEAFDEYSFKITLSGIGEVTQQWIKPDGTLQKSLPAFVKESTKFSDKLKKLRDLVKQIKQASTAQRDRIDRLYLENLSWNKEDFEKYYLNHGLICVIARKLIWVIDGRPAFFHNENWIDENSNSLSVHNDSKFHLWHPIETEPDSVLKWRDVLNDLEIKQPVKQAYREIYLLTDAEITTRIYSNRMAAHILKQHQFNTLAALRGWSYSLLGAYDDGRNGEIARKPLPDSALTAQFWINEIIDDVDSFNDAGIWYYVATDQVRFVNKDDEPVELIHVPKLVLSEIMRDVDLFVGVASVGNDPQWQDGGPDARQDYRDYWHSYSFGDLTEIAKTRKNVLERLLPRLKIRDKAKIDGNFLFVTGTKHTYKIHIGSGNILIAPNDQYLCIVPGRGKDNNVDKLFLPFEGDSGLSIVLSKAFLLAEDDKIADPTILSQI